MHITSPERTLHVSYYGFNERDRRLLYTVAAMSALSIRQHAYTCKEEDAAADILLVEATNKQAVHSWMQMYRQQPLLPTLIAAPQQLQNSHFYRVSYPLIVTEVMQALDFIAKSEFPHIGALYQQQAA